MYKIDDLTVGVLSYKAHKTIKASLDEHKRHGLCDLPARFFVFFNAMSGLDILIAQDAGIEYHGSEVNLGIYGGFRAIAELAKTKYVLILENDLRYAVNDNIFDYIKSAINDMDGEDIKIFCLKNRMKPQNFASGRIDKYLNCFPVYMPLTPTISAQSTPIIRRIMMLLKHGYVSKFRSRAIYAESYPEKAQPKAIRKLPSGNFCTTSKYCNWSNQAILVDRNFFLNVICARVDSHPDPRLVNGHQDIERAINSWWWRRRNEPIGHAEVGIFTHARLDR